MADSEPMDPEYEQRLRRRLEILREEIEAGRIHINAGLEVINSLKAVRYSADGQVDLSTVDGLVRSLALTAEMFDDRRKLKEAISLREAQQIYFDTIEANFKSLYAEMVRHDVNPHDIAKHVSSDTGYRNAIAKDAPAFLAGIEEFWQAVGPSVHVHLEDMSGILKCVFGGDLFPDNSENIASKCGIYTDTIILPDPFLRSRDIFPRWRVEQQVYYIVKHALNVLKYKDLACADLSPPIVVIVPDYKALQESEKKFILKVSEDDTLFHAKKVFGREFESVDDLMRFARKLETVDAVLAQIHDQDRVLFDTSWKLSLRDAIVRAQKDESAGLLRTENAGLIVAALAVGRMAVSNELLIKARRLGGCPVIDAPTSWQYFNWKLEYDALRAGEVMANEDMHVLRALEALADGEMHWLGRVPPAALLEIRKEGALPEIRQMLSKGVDSLVNSNPANFYRTTDKIFDNIHLAFADHQKRIDELRSKKWKFAAKEIGSWVAVGTIEVSAALTGTPIWGLATIAANQLTDAPKLKDIPASIKALAEENRKIKRSPVGMLFQYKKDN